jgi:hypothetical protein
MTPPSPGENIVTLNAREAMHAAQVGVARHLRCRRDGIPNADGSPYREADWGANVEGAGAECAFAKWAGVYWNPPTELDDGIDVAGCQVKCTGFPGGRLIIPDRQPLQIPCVLLTGQLPTYTVRGWTWPEQADAKWLQERGGRRAYWIPQEALYPLADLKAWIRDQAAA